MTAADAIILIYAAALLAAAIWNIRAWHRDTAAINAANRHLGQLAAEFEDFRAWEQEVEEQWH